MIVSRVVLSAVLALGLLSAKAEAGTKSATIVVSHAAQSLLLFAPLHVDQKGRNSRGSLGLLSALLTAARASGGAIVIGDAVDKAAGG